MRRWCSPRHPHRTGACHHGLGFFPPPGRWRPAAVHLDGRDPVPYPPVGRNVPRPCPVAAMAAGAPAAGEHRRLRHLRRRFRLFRRHLRDGGKDRFAGTGKARLRQQMALGTLAGSGTLGLLIPPSIPMVVYAVTANVSVLQVFLAGFLPGLLVMGLYSGYVILWSLLNPGKTPPRDPPMSFRRKMQESAKLIPCLLLILGFSVARHRPCHGHRMRRLGRARRSGAGALEPHAHLAAVHRKPHGRHASHLHDHADHRRCGLHHRRHGLYGHSGGAGGMGAGAQPDTRQARPRADRHVHHPGMPHRWHSP